MCNSSPSWSCFDRLARSPFTSTLPVSIAFAASARVLKKRAAHSHLSSRTLAISSELILALPEMRLRSQKIRETPYGQGALRASGRLVITTKKDRTGVPGTSAGAVACVQEAAERRAKARPGAHQAARGHDRWRRASGACCRARRRSGFLAIRESVRIRAVRLPGRRSSDHHRRIVGGYIDMARATAK